MKEILLQKVCITNEKVKIENFYVNSNTSIVYVFNLISDSFFRICNVSDIENWNEYIGESWCGLDDSDYYNETPCLEENDTNWHFYYNGVMSSVDEYIKMIERKMKEITLLKSIIQ